MQLFIQQVIQWWVILFLLGLIAMPFTSKFLSIFFDKGYAFTKIVGIILISYVSLVLGTLHILAFNVFSLSLITAFVALTGYFFANQRFNLSFVKIHWKIFLLEEIIFLFCLFFWSFIKGFQPDIHGLEKFMDYGFLNSILRTSYFPPKDMWMTPLSINYYYFGHLTTAVLTKLSFLPSNVTFNLMLASLFAFTFLGSFSLSANMVYLLRQHEKRITKLILPVIFGLFTAFLVTFSGNLHALYTFFTPYQNDTPVAPTKLTFSPQTFPNQYWYPNATRFIYHTIHEFPIYSFVVSDLHGHVLDIPNVLLMIAFLLVFFFSTYKTQKDFLFQSMLLGSLTGIMYMTNAWDGLIYLGVTTLIIFFKSFRIGMLYTIFSKKFFVRASVLLISFFIISLPFSIFFKPFASQVGLNCAPEFLLHIGAIGPLIFEKGFCEHSPLWQLAILYGFFFFWFISFVFFLFITLRKTSKIYTIDLFVLGLGTLGFFLIILPEFVYLKDIYTTYFRANTMFKLVYQSFILLSLVSGYTIFRIFTQMQFGKKQFMQKIFVCLFFIIGIVLIMLVSIYPYFAISSYFDNLKLFQGLNGTKYLKTINSDDYNAIIWLNDHIKGQPVVLEAQGDSYTDYERVSSNTGLPTVFGWMVHEWLWRGTYDIVPGRVADVKVLYESQSLSATKELLKKYTVSYVYIGDMERSKYKNIDTEKFDKLGKVIYSSGSVKIYKIN